MRIVAMIVCFFLALLDGGEAVRYNGFWNKVSRGRDVGSDITSMKILFVFTPALISILLIICIFLVVKNRKSVMFILGFSFLIAIYGMLSSEGTRFAQAEDLNNLMQSNLVFLVIAFIFVLLSYIIQKAKAKKLIAASRNKNL